jgi:hypothetical protein
MHNFVLWIILLLSFPLVVMAGVPILRPLYRLVGERFVFTVQGTGYRNKTALIRSFNSDEHF